MLPVSLEAKLAELKNERNKLAHQPVPQEPEKGIK